MMKDGRLRSYGAYVLFAVYTLLVILECLIQHGSVNLSGKISLVIAVYIPIAINIVAYNTSLARALVANILIIPFSALSFYAYSYFMRQPPYHWNYIDAGEVEGFYIYVLLPASVVLGLVIAVTVRLISIPAKRRHPAL